jgi:hypothetical protein
MGFFPHVESDEVLRIFEVSNTLHDSRVFLPSRTDTSTSSLSVDLSKRIARLGRPSSESELSRRIDVTSLTPHCERGICPKHKRRQCYSWRFVEGIYREPSRMPEQHTSVNHCLSCLGFVPGSPPSDQSPIPICIFRTGRKWRTSGVTNKVAHKSDDMIKW